MTIGSAAAAAGLLLCATAPARASGASLTHLTAASKLLDEASKGPAPDKIEKRLADTRKDFGLMQMAYASHGDWNDHFSDVENDLIDLIGGGTHAEGTTGSGGDIPAPINSDTADAPLSSSFVKDVGMADMSPTLRSQLEQFRVELELFMASTMIDVN